MTGDLLIDLEHVELDLDDIEAEFSPLRVAGYLCRREERIERRLFAEIDAMVHGELSPYIDGGGVIICERDVESQFSSSAAEDEHLRHPDSVPYLRAWGWSAFQSRRIVNLAGYLGRRASPKRLRALHSDSRIGTLGPLHLHGLVPELQIALVRAGLAALKSLGYRQASIPFSESGMAYDKVRNAFGDAVSAEIPLPAHRRRRFVACVEPKTALYVQTALRNFKPLWQRDLELIGMILSRDQNVKPTIAEELRADGTPVALMAWDRAEESREAYDRRFLEVMSAMNPDLVLLTWEHIVADTLISAFPEVFNVHGSYLDLDPREDHVVFPDGTEQKVIRGIDPIVDGMKAKHVWGGFSFHRVTSEVDRGEIFARYPFRLMNFGFPSLIETYGVAIARGLRAWAAEHR